MVKKTHQLRQTYSLGIDEYLFLLKKILIGNKEFVCVVLGMKIQSFDGGGCADKRWSYTKYALGLESDAAYY